MRVSRRTFEKLVREAMDQIPPPFRNHLAGIAVLVETKPSVKTLKSLGLGPKDELLGLYDGVPLTEKSHSDSMTLPDRITLYQGPLMKSCRNLRELKKEIAVTVIHELAHHYGLSEKEIEERGFG